MSDEDMERLALSFNPRSREGNDNITDAFNNGGINVSIHVPARGTTEYRKRYNAYKEVSIHVPARGTTAITYNFHL